jgi:hypothetical protein
MTARSRPWDPEESSFFSSPEFQVVDRIEGDSLVSPARPSGDEIVRTSLLSAAALRDTYRALACSNRFHLFMFEAIEVLITGIGLYMY